jgi:pimeloyl-ACP methyl ester carboxylesterase
VRKVLLGVYANAAAVDDELVNLICLPSEEEGALETFVSVVTGADPGPRPEALIPQIAAATPILTLWGDRDTFTPMDGPVGRYFQSLPAARENTEFVTLPGERSRFRPQILCLGEVWHCDAILGLGPCRSA